MQKRINIKAEILFVIIGLFWGLVFLIINPPFQAPDEEDHLFKMWGILNGTHTFKVLNNQKGQILPNNLVLFSMQYSDMKESLDIHTSKDEIIKSKNITLDKNNNIFFAQTPTSYTVVSYIPMIFVLFILKACNVAPFFMVYILRFCCLVTYLAIMYQAIKIVPAYKWLFFTLALLPANLYIASAINTDCLVISVAFLLFSYTLYLKFDENVIKISKRQIVIWGCIFSLLCVLKYLYFPLILLYFLIPKEKFEVSKRYIKYFFLLGVINVIYIILFLLNIVILSASGSDKYHSDSLGTIYMIRLLVYHPILYLKALFLTFIATIYSNSRSFITQFGCKPFFMSNYAIVLFYCLIFLSLFYDNEKIKLTVKNKLVMLSSVMLSYIIILTSIAIIYGAYPIMIGFQGRYASPYIPVVFMLLTFSIKKIQNKAFLYSGIILMQLLYCYASYVILNRFY